MMIVHNMILYSEQFVHTCIQKVYKHKTNIIINVVHTVDGGVDY
jgi:hypothetical protein